MRSHITSTGLSRNGHFSATIELEYSITTLQDMLDVSWIPVHDAEEIVCQRGPNGRLIELDTVVADNIIVSAENGPVDWSGNGLVCLDDGNLEETQSLLSDTLSLGEEMEAIPEANRMLCQYASPWDPALLYPPTLAVVETLC